MKESYKVRPSQSPWPRVMRCVGQPAGRSVHRGTTGRCMELRKHPFEVADLILIWGEGNSHVERSWRVRCDPHGVKDHRHGWKLSSRKPRDPGDIRFSMADRSEKARGHHPDMHVAGESHSFIVPEKPANKGRVPRPSGH